MDRKLVEQAIDDGCQEQLRTMFAVLVEGMLLESRNVHPNPDDGSTAAERFKRGTLLLTEARLTALQALGISSRG